MAEIGKSSPHTTPNLSPNLDGVENHKRRPSTLSSNGSLMDPPSPDFPRHPSYHHEPLNPSIDPLIRCKTPFSAISTPIDRTPYMSSPALSSLRTPSTAVNSSSGASFFSESEKTPIHMEKIHDVPVRPVSVAKPKKNQKGQKSQKKMREVTQELVPSDDELFG
ncbi:hypothetical protein FQN55_006720 [Onygenales sp. PD_40]|nr:hypothetical protein FQN55_006720 [Onygenales sp. PD_40]KAK2779976.1 hypothetical protein FQN53_001162 [Emmonsiellopsis sp. PD_33]